MYILSMVYVRTERLRRGKRGGLNAPMKSPGVSEYACAEQFVNFLNLRLLQRVDIMAAEARSLVEWVSVVHCSKHDQLHKRTLCRF